MNKPLIQPVGLKHLHNVIERFDLLSDQLAPHLPPQAAFNFSAALLSLKQAANVIDSDFKDTQELKAGVLRAVYKAGKYGSNKPSA